MKRKKKNPAFDKEALRRDIARDHRREGKEKRASLERELREARAARRRAAGDALTKCKVARAVVRERFAAARKVRDEARAKKAAARGVCEIDTSGLPVRASSR